MTGLSIDRQKKKNKQGQTKADSPPLNIKEKLALKKEERQKKQKLTGLIVFAICVAILLGFPLSLLFDANIGAAVSLALILGVFPLSIPARLFGHLLSMSPSLALLSIGWEVVQSSSLVKISFIYPL